MRNKVLVTGAAGFIGSHVAHELVESGSAVVAVDDLSGGFADNVPDGARFELLDVTDGEAVGALFEREGPFEVVYHLAAYAAEGLSHFVRRFNYTNNVIGSVNLINEAVRHDARCFVFTSSIAVYGTNQLPMTEDLVPRPEDPYGIAKYTVELDLAAAREQFGLDHVVFRPHNVYGERQNVADRYRNVVGIFMNQLLSGRPMTVYGDGEQTRAFSYVGDVAPLIARAPDVEAARNRVFNVGADEPCTVLELGIEVARALGVEARFEHLPARNEVQHAHASHEAVRSVFGDAPTVPLGEGLARMACWLRSVDERGAVAAPRIELTKNFPRAWKHHLEH